MLLKEHSLLTKLDCRILLYLYRASLIILSGMRALALQAKEAGRSNVAFLAFFVTGQVGNESQAVPYKLLICTPPPSIALLHVNDVH